MTSLLAGFDQRRELSSQQGTKVEIFPQNTDNEPGELTDTGCGQGRRSENEIG